MHFDRIKFDGKKVELEYTELGSAGTNRDVQIHGDNPTPSFKNALKAFTSFVVWIHSWDKTLVDGVEVRGVSIKRPHDAPRGIVVTALLKCPRARNSTSTINTPYLSEPPEGYSGAMDGLLTSAVSEFIDTLENEAALYVSGERGEQTSLGLDDSQNAHEFDQRAAAASSSTTRNPKPKKKGEDHVPGVGPVLNPEANEAPPGDKSLREKLFKFGRDVPLDAIAKWTGTQRDAVNRWLAGQERVASGDLRADSAPKEPNILELDATKDMLE